VLDVTVETPDYTQLTLKVSAGARIISVFSHGYFRVIN
jgi:hypothetical protein